MNASVKPNLQPTDGLERRSAKLGIALMLMFGALFVNLFWIQVIDGPRLANHPGNTRNAVRDFGQLRGNIITADGTVVAESSRNPNTESKFTYLRKYPLKRRYAHVVGYFSFTYGSNGIERTYNNVLAGREGALVLSKRKMDQLLKDRVEVSDVTLTIDDSVQRAAATALGNRKGSVVAIDTRTGAVLALYSWPSFDPNPLAGTDQKQVIQAWKVLEADTRKPTLARAWRQVYPPGSTFKAITAASGLQAGTVSIGTEYPILSELALPLTNRPLKNFGGKECGGSLLESFVVSCNTSFAQLGLDVGADELRNRATAFGFGEAIPLDVSPGPVASRFPPASFFDRNTPALAQSAIGQGEVAATPLQMALVAAAIANGGRIPTPFLVAKVQERSGAVVREGEQSTWRTATTEAVAADLTTMMTEAVERGTGTRAKVAGVSVAAKTGTAQTTAGAVPANGGAAPPRAHAWTIGFAPADNPRVAIAVIIEDQDEVSATTGGKIAAPVLSQVMTAALKVIAP
jgi:penicillin-binding protein A